MTSPSVPTLPVLGASASLDKTVTEADVVAFAAVSLDANPVHLDEAYAATTRFGGRIAHGMLAASLVSAVLGTRLPGPGTIYLSQTLAFKGPVRLGDTITATVTVKAIKDGKPIVTLDTIVATNLHADILSDLAAALAGSLGIAPTGNIDPERRYPSMFEPIHGSAFDIMGKGLANPVGTFWSVVMMLEHLGETAAAGRVMKAVEHVTGQPLLHTRDLGGNATTSEVTAAVCRAIASQAGAA